MGIRIAFTYRGVFCRETLKNILADKNGIKYADRLRAEILSKIERQQFNYAEYFPHSKRAHAWGIQNKNALIKDLLQKIQEEDKETNQKSTYKRSASVINYYLLPCFGNVEVGSLKASHIRDFLQSLARTRLVKNSKTGEINRKPLNVKTVRSILSPLRKVVKRALNDELLKANPFDTIVLEEILPKESYKSDYVVNTFTMEEIWTILRSLPDAVRPMVQFWLFTGLRPSEIMALTWPQVDFVRRLLRVKRALVEDEVKETKTEAGMRDMELLEPAYDALIAQKEFTFKQGEYIFINPGKAIPWENSKQLREWWIRVCNKANVPYRNPYQCRHTYATMLMLGGESVPWIAGQMGHVDTEMVIRTYAKLPKVGEYKRKNDWGQVFY